MGALALRYTGPLTVAPPGTRSCPKYAPASSGSSTIVLFTLPVAVVAVSHTSVVAVTVAVFTRKVVEFPPPEMVTESGTPRAPLLLDRYTTVPSEGAASPMFTLTSTAVPRTSSRALKATELPAPVPANRGDRYRNGVYNGSPTFRIRHFSHRVLRRKASPTFAPSSRLRTTPPGRAIPSRYGSLIGPDV